jgi:hypothetical protein
MATTALAPPRATFARAFFTKTNFSSLFTEGPAIYSRGIYLSGGRQHFT